MSTAIGLNGGWISRSISSSDVQNIKNARTLNDVSSTWGKIKDWFCGTHLEDAKKNLFILFNDKITTKDKYIAFGILKDLSAESFKQNFKQSENELMINTYDGERLFSLKKNFVTVDKEAISSSIMKDTEEAKVCEENFLKDFSRNSCHGVYSLNGNKVTAEEQLACFTASDLTCIKAIANQRLFGTIMDEVSKSHSLMDCLAEGTELSYDITQLDNGKIKVIASTYKDVALAENTDDLMSVIKDSDMLKRTLSITATFEIDKSNISAINVEYYTVN